MVTIHNTQHGWLTMSQGKPKTINEAFAMAMRQHRKENAYSYKQDGQWIAVSHEIFANQVREARGGFLQLGVQRGDRIGLLSENRLEWLITDLAMLSCGGVTVPIYATSTGPQCAYILNDAEAKIICVSSQKQLEKILGVIDTIPQVKTIVVFDEVSKPANLPDGIELITFENLRRMGSSTGQSIENFLDDLVTAAAPDDLATLIYTSGTTGEPKGVMLTHSNITSNMLAGLERIVCRPDDVALSYLPLSHILERTVMYVFMYSGVTVYFAESVDLVAKNLGEVQPTVMTSVPRVFEKILNKIEEEVNKAGGLKAKLYYWAMEIGKECAKAENEGQSVGFVTQIQKSLADALVLSKVRNKLAPRIRFFVSGGAALSGDVAFSFAAMGLPILQGYGLTETSPVIALSSLEENRFGTVGKPISNVEVKIAEDGEIIVRGPNVMQGYYKRSQATAEVLRDGWFSTGDIGCLDSDGYLKITDRKKDLFKTSGGKYIAPQPIENKLTSSPYILQAVVIGAERKFPSALIVPRIDLLQEHAHTHGIKYTSTSELLAHSQIVDLIQKEVDRLTPELANYEKIKKIALLESEMTIEGGELTPTLKVKRRIVDQKYRDMIEKIYAERAKAAGKD